MPPEMELKKANVQEWSQTYNKTHNVALLARHLTETPAWEFFPINQITRKYLLERHDANMDVTLILVDLPPQIIQAIIDGRLHEKIHRKDHIAIYANAIVDKNGTHPTIRETRDIVRLMDRYVSGENGVGHDINNQVTNTDWVSNPGFEQWRYIPNENVKKNVLGFIQKAKLRCDLAESDGDDVDKPLRYGFHDVGYAKVASDRLRSHAKHQSSNMIMNLFEACASWTHPKFSVDGIVVHRIRFRYLASRAEIYITILFHCWAFDGTGFTHFFPGASVHSSAKEELILQGGYSTSLLAARTYPFSIIKKALVIVKSENERMRQEMARLDAEEDARAKARADAILKRTDAMREQLAMDLKAIKDGLAWLRADKARNA